MPRQIFRSLHIAAFTLRCASFPTFAAAQTSAGPAPIARASFAGAWTLTLMAEPEAVVGTLALQQSGDALAGTYVSEHLGTMRIVGTTANSKVTFAADGQAHGQDVHIEFIGVVKADGSLAGELTSPLGSMAWTALRLKK